MSDMKNAPKTVPLEKTEARSDIEGVTTDVIMRVRVVMPRATLRQVKLSQPR
jgi:hypothetical protein